jgi:hypothetical protein
VTTPQTIGKVNVGGIMQSKVFGLPVHKEIMFSNHKDKYKSRIEKRQRKLISRLSFLRPFLEPDENILLVTTGHSPPTVLEKFGIGWLFLYLKRSLFVFTDRRIFHVPTTPIYRYRGSITQIPYTACESIQMKGASLLVQYKGGGEPEKFLSLSGREKKKVRELLNIISFEGPQASVAGRVHLCPQCASALYSSISQCGSCGLRFKTPGVAAFLAIVLPGGGYFYLRQPFLGAAFALLEIAAAALIAISWYGIANTGVSNLLWGGGGILMLGLLKAFAVVHVRIILKEYIPRKTDITFQKVAAASP